VDESNLQRQVIHGTSDVGKSKAVSARESIAEINPLVTVILHEERLDSGNAMQIFAGYDLIVDGTDNFATRYLVNDACVLLGKPYVWGSIYRFDGQASVFWAEHGPCYRCLYPEPPRRAWCRPAPRAASWACCARRSAPSRSTRPSSSSPGSASHWPAA
jgi:adenylyltransferase/sulfurtransferase